MRQFLKTGAVAEMLKVHPNTLRKWADEGYIPCHRIGPKRARRFDEAEISDYIESCSNGKGA